MRVLLAAVLLVGMCVADDKPAPPPKRNTKPSGEITYEVNKDSGYDFYREAKRIAYSKRGRRAGCQTLYALADKKMKKDETIVEVTSAMSLWLDANNQRLALTPKDKYALEVVLREEPNPKMAGKRFPLPSVEGVPAAAKPTPLPGQVTIDNVLRLVKRTDAPPQKIGVLTYYRNQGGGYTFMERGHLAFYALPYKSCTSKAWKVVVKQDKLDKEFYSFLEETTVSTVGTSTMPFGGLAVYRSEMFQGKDNWTRDTAKGQFRLSILAEDNETRLKLKSIIPVLEHAPTSPLSKP
jgi:hypothetical protein